MSLRYPNILNIFSLLQDVPRNQRMVKGMYVPGRPDGYPGVSNRVRAAWLVFTGKADAVTWPEDNPLFNPANCAPGKPDDPLERYAAPAQPEAMPGREEMIAKAKSDWDHARGFNNARGLWAREYAPQLLALLSSARES